MSFIEDPYLCCGDVLSVNLMKCQMFGQEGVLPLEINFSFQHAKEKCLKIIWQLSFLQGHTQCRWCHCEYCRSWGKLSLSLLIPAGIDCAQKSSSSGIERGPMVHSLDPVCAFSIGMSVLLSAGTFCMITNAGVELVTDVLPSTLGSLETSLLQPDCSWCWLLSQRG